MGSETEISIPVVMPTTPVPLSAISISAYMDGSGGGVTGSFKAVLRAAGSGTSGAAPGDVLAVGSVFTVTAGAAAAWKTSTITYSGLIAGATYYISIIRNTAAGSHRIAHDNTTVPGRWSENTAGGYATPPTWNGTGFGTNTAGRAYIYMTYQIVDVTPPTGSFTTPAADYMVVSGAAVSLAVSAMDADSSVASVVFKDPAGGTIATDTVSPYVATWDSTTTNDGPATLTAVITDAVGLTTTVSRTVTVANRVDVASPLVKIWVPWLDNPGIESGFYDWQSLGTAVLTQSATHVHSGSWAGKVKSNGTGAYMITNPGGDAGSGMNLGMVAGGTYTFSAWVYVPSGVSIGFPTQAVYIEMYDKTDAGYANTAGNAVAALDTWTLLTVTRTIRAGATEAFCRIVANGIPLTTAPEIYFDDATWGVAGTVPVRVSVYDDLSVAKVELLVDGAVAQTLATDLDNKVFNGHFEVDTTGWATVVGGTLTRSTAEKKYGAAGASLVAGAATHGLRNDSGLSCTIGTVYSVGLWVKGTAAATIRVSIRDAANALVGSNQDITLVGGSFQYVEFEFTPTATGIHKLQVAALSGAQTFYVDGGWICREAIFQLQTAFLTNGAHTISARVTDGAANATTTSTVALDVLNVFQKGPSIKVEIGFASKPRDDVQTWTDVSTYLRQQISWYHGRADAEGRVDAGQATLTLDNRDRRFDPQNAAGPYYANLKARRLRITVNYAGSVLVVHEGTIQGWPPDRRPGGTRSYVTITSVDDFDPLNRKMISSSNAALTTALTGTNNDLVFTSKYGGGEDIEIEYVSSTADQPNLSTDAVPRLRWQPPRVGYDGRFGAFGGRSKNWWSPTHAAGPPPSLAVDGRRITVNVVVSGGAVTTTAAQVAAAIAASPAANALVSVANAPSNDGTGVVTAMAPTKLIGGVRVLEKSGARIAWVLDQLGHPTSRRAIDAGAFDVQAVTLVQAPGLQHAKEVGATELGIFFIDGTGKAVFHDSANRAARVTKATFTTAKPLTGEFSMLATDENFDWDKVRNDIVVSAPGLDDALASDATSQIEYWPRSHQAATLLTTQAQLTTRAALLLANFKDPKARVEQIRIIPARQANETQSTSVWVMALSMEISDKLALKITPAGGGSVVTYTVFVERVEHRVALGNNGVSTWETILAVSN